jgi:hypothetical protein
VAAGNTRWSKDILSIQAFQSDERNALSLRTAILAGSPDKYGMNKKLIDDEVVTEGW